MSVDKSWSNIGNEIRDAVEDALKTGNFRDLGDTVTGTVKDVTGKVGQAVSEGISGKYNYTEAMAKATRERKQAERMQKQAANGHREKPAPASMPPFTKVGGVSGVLYTVFGAIGTGIMSLLCLIFFGVSFLVEGGLWSPFLFCMCLLAPFAGMLCVGGRKRKLLKRAKKYLEMCGHNHYCNIDQMAMLTGMSERKVLKEVKKLLRLGFFPEGHLDAKGTCLMLNNKVYKEYLDLEKQRKQFEQEQRTNKVRTAQPQVKAEEKSELEKMVAEGQDCIKRLRDMNDNIPGEEISAKLFRLENLLKRIFEALQEHPDQMPQMRKFMNYYLPTTLKLVNAYEEFDHSSAQGGEVVEAKTEIEKTMDTINSAFEELLNRMLRDTAFDVTTDAQVLQTMLAQEGLTREKEFVNIPK